jgi:ubiquinone/menaquinone biosynthesis C-methylase UbiE
MATQNERTDFYSVKYSSFDSEVARVVRREAFGEDIGQQGWRTETEQAQIIDLLGIDRSSLVLDICCGSGGPSLTLVQRTGCRLSGIDRESAGIAHARVQAAARGLSDQATFSLVDCAGPLPFENDNFDAVLCIDAVPHLPDRFGTLREWSRLLRKKGRLVFTDNAVVTGEVAKGELDLRTASGFFLFVPPGLNEEAVKAAGLSVLRCDDTTTAMA